MVKIGQNFNKRPLCRAFTPKIVGGITSAAGPAQARRAGAPTWYTSYVILAKQLHKGNKDRG